LFLGAVFLVFGLTIALEAGIRYAPFVRGRLVYWQSPFQLDLVLPDSFRDCFAALPLA
jgi:hypothetical protein